MGRTAHEIPRLREAGDHPAGRAIPSAGQAHAGEARHPQGDLLPLVRSLPEPAGRRPSTTARPGRIGSGTASRTLSASRSRSWRWTSRRCRRASWPCASPTRRLLCLRGLGLPPAQGARSDRQPGLHRHQGGGRVQRQDHGAQPALADRLHLPQGHRLGLVLSVDRARRLLALHHRLEAVHHA